MSLPWVRLDTQFASNPKVIDLIERKKYRAVVVYVCSLGYAGAHQSDGFIQRSALKFLHGTATDATDLVMARLWHCTEGGWGINDWSEYQESKLAMEERLSRKKLASKKANCTRWHKEDCQCWKK